MTPLAAKRRAKKTRALNRRFDRASPEQKRVMIARDVLERLSRKRYRPSHCYVNFEKDETGDSLRLKRGPLQPQLKGPAAPVCVVCGIGALFCSTVRVFNRFRVPGRALIGVEIRPLLRQFFAPGQVCLIELAYEEGRVSGEGRDHKDTTPEQWQAAIDFGRRFPYVRHDGCSIGGNDTRRLRAIMNNIVKNRGTFVP